MDEQKVAIPEDLRKQYHDACTDMCPSGGWRGLAKGYIERIATREAENAALKSTVASLLSIDDSKVAEYVVLSPEALREAAGNRVAELEAKVARLEAPVSDEDAEEIYFASNDGWLHTQHAVDHMLAARSTPPAKERITEKGGE